MVQIYTCSMSKSKFLIKDGWDKNIFLDITVKSGDKTFAPSWDIVMGHKKKEITDDDYIRTYRQMMLDSYKKNKKRWEDVLHMDKVVFMCYCPHKDKSKEKVFCHRYILASYFEKLGAKYIGEIE